MRYDSFILQKEIYLDIQLQRPFINKDFDFINSINDNYPSLNVFGMPLVSLKAQYYLSRDSIEKGINYLKEGAKRNPYIGFSESVLGETFLKLRDGANANYYIREAFNKIPNNPVHYVLLVKLLKYENKNDSILYYYNKVKDKMGPKDFQVYNIVLASFIESQDTLKKYNADEITKEALLYHPENPKIKLMTDYVIYSRNNVDLAANKYKDAMEIFQSGDVNKGINILKEVIELHPNVSLYYNNLVIALFNSNRFQDITFLWDLYSTNFKTVNPQILYYFTYSFAAIGDNERTCSLLNVLVGTNFSFDRSIFPKCF